MLRAGGPLVGQTTDWPAFFGLHNISTTPGCAGVPIVALQQFGSWGFPSGSCLIPTSQIFSFYDNASWVKGRHRISFGGNLERVNLRHEVAFTPQGNFSFTGQFTEGFDGTNRMPNTGNAIADSSWAGQLLRPRRPSSRPRIAVAGGGQPMSTMTFKSSRT